MTKTIRRYSLVLVILMIGVFAIACSSKKGNNEIDAQGIVFGNGNGSETMNLVIGKADAELNATVTPANATRKTLIWSSSDEKIATVDENGKIHAVAPGKATISALVDGLDSISEKQEVTVFSAATKLIADAPVDELTQGNASMSNTTIEYSVEPASAYQLVTFSSSNSLAVSVGSTSGVVNVQNAALAKNVTITATLSGQYTQNGQAFTQEIPFDLYTAPTGISLEFDKDNIDEIYMGGPTTKLNAKVLADTAKQDIVWSVSDDSVAVVSSEGTVFAQTKEIAEPQVVSVSAASKDFQNTKNSKQVTVYAAPTSMTLATPFAKSDEIQNTEDEQSEVFRRYAIGSKLKLEAEIAPVAAKQTLEWSVTTDDMTRDASDIATVSEDGIFEALSEGIVTITVSDFFGVVSDSMTISVEPSAFGFDEDTTPENLNTVVGQNSKFNPSLFGGEQSQLRGNYFDVVDASIISLDSTGRLNALAAGQTQILVGSPLADTNEVGVDQMLWHSTFVDVNVITRADDFVVQYDSLNKINNDVVTDMSDDEVLDLLAKLNGALSYMKDITRLEKDTYEQNASFMAMVTVVNDLYDNVVFQIENRKSEELSALEQSVYSALNDDENGIFVSILKLSIDISKTISSGILVEESVLKELNGRADAITDQIQLQFAALNDFEDGADNEIDLYILNELRTKLDKTNSNLETLKNKLIELGSQIAE